ncbi:DUF4189 domain-containing protein [Altererythrobacter sp. BO-6]|uniref:DUF4189 domain-containing protein n=1 Tax=Altererythrobacter sp. BO-6 TaxID=2604537 RepID=UPI0013E1B812|nr:DUF4189 domain-containing protein [Altererythrobacter sp. BO-6]QIG55076.1 DUF4189 domain-containing protein [Altererythrobacter sp. BO-6]
MDTSNPSVPVPLCPGGTSQQGQPQAALVDYANIAWHPDYDEVWFGGGWTQRGRSEAEVLALCNRETGGGCSSIGEYSNSYLAIVKSGNGDLYYGWGQGSGAARKDALKNCRTNRRANVQPLPCELVGTYNALTRKYITPKDLKSARKLYGAGAWVVGTEGYDRRAWFATGHPSREAATSAAIAACKKANSGRECEAFGLTGNGFIQAFQMTVRGEKTADDMVIVETSAKRAGDAAKAVCKANKKACVLQTTFDTRKPGLFEHSFKTGVTSPL